VLSVIKCCKHKPPALWPCRHCSSIVDFAKVLLAWEALKVHRDHTCISDFSTGHQASPAFPQRLCKSLGTVPPFMGSRMPLGRQLLYLMGPSLLWFTKQLCVVRSSRSPCHHELLPRFWPAVDSNATELWEWRLGQLVTKRLQTTEKTACLVQCQFTSTHA
jgi:hypothetical protein